MTKVTWTYIVIAFGITWGICLPAYYLYSRGTLTLNQLNLIYNGGALGPFVGAPVFFMEIKG